MVHVSRLVVVVAQALKRRLDPPLARCLTGYARWGVFRRRRRLEQKGGAFWSLFAEAYAVELQLREMRSLPDRGCGSLNVFD